MSRLRYKAGAAWLLSLMLLSGCDDNNSDTPLKAAASQPTATARSSATELSAEQRAAQQAREQGKPLQVIDISEVQLDGAGTLVVTFSVSLNEQQNFNQYAHIADSKSGALEGGWELSPNRKELRFRHLEPARELKVRVDSGLKAANGATLEKAAEQMLTTRDIQPMVGFASRGSLLPTRITTGLPVMALNVNQVDVDFFRIKMASLPAFIADWQYGNSLQTWQSESLLQKADLVYTGRFDLNPARNTREQLQLPLGDIKPLSQSGVYLAVMKQAGTYSYTNAATLFTLSDISLSLHQFPQRVDLFSQRLEDGASLDGVALSMLDEKGHILSQATTDDQGHATLPWQAKAKLILATKNDQTSLIDLSRPALDLAEFAVAGPEGYDKQLFIFGPRDLYRPGETLIANALMRDADGKPLPPQPVKLDIVKPDGDTARTLTWQPENGLWQLRYPLPKDAPTGRWMLRVDAGDGRPRQWPFSVEDFMPERMALSLTASDRPVSPTSDINFHVSGRYLYGAPAAGNRLQGQLFLRPDREAVKSLPGYQFGDINEQGLKRNLDEIDLTLDTQGKASVAAPASWQEIASPARLILQASLLESGGRPVTRRVSQAIWPAEVLPGIRPLFASKEVYDYRNDTTLMQPVVDENSSAEFSIVLANARGEKITDQQVEVRLIRERRDYYWSFAEGDGWQSRYDQKDLVEETRQITLSAEGEARVAFPVEWGSYRIEAVAPDSERRSSIRFWAGYSWQDNTDGTGAVRPDQVKLKLDKANYQPGDRAMVQIEAPAAGKGYLLVESSGGPLWWQTVDVPAGGIQVAVPVDKAWRRHDLYFSALVIRPGDKAQGITPKRAVGILHLPMQDEARRLNLTLTAPQKIRPNQNLTIKVKASSAGGDMPKQVQVLLSAVDSGVLNITDYKTPDPYAAFFGRKRYNADQYDVYGQLIEGQGRLAALRFGGDGDEGDPLKRGGQQPVNHVNILATQLQPVTLDANGEGTITLPIPEFNGEMRLMAQAWSEDRFGQSESTVVVAAPLITQMASPRFLAGGDSSRLALDITNLTERPQTLTVNLQASGLVTLMDPSPRQISLRPGERTTLLVPVSAAMGYGEGSIEALITGVEIPGENVAPGKGRWVLGVRPAWPAETRSFNAVIRPGTPWQLPAENFSGLEPATVQSQLALSGRPPLNIARYISELYAWPYGCLEQTISGLWPSLYTNHKELTALGIKSGSDSERHAAIETGIDRIGQMQRYNGGFGLWGKESAEEFWLTAYAMDFLTRAGEQGYHPDKTILAKGNERLLRYLQDGNQIEVYYSNDAAATRFNVQSYAALVLARQQKAPLGALRALYEQRAQAKSGLALVQLGVALKLMGDTPRANALLDQGIHSVRPAHFYWLEDYGSPLRDSAQIVTLLREYQLLPEAQDDLIIALAQQLNGKQWLSTQENNALFLAAHTLEQDESTVWQVRLNEQEALISGNKTRILPPGESLLDAGITVNSLSEAPVYGRLEVVGYPQIPPPASSHNLAVRREYLDLNGNPLSLTAVKSGQLILVHLTVSATDRVPDALVTDLLPAGLELENQNLASASASLGESAANVQELMNDMQQVSIKHMEFRDDRFVAAIDVDNYRPAQLLYLARAVTPGNYQVPAPQVESMYVPQWRATGETPARLTVR
ncbi:alpha-2-macroglobulin family protein [Pantoea sp. FN0307]|uniref:alpha-2-macroglobulin family protein n=1 Tax=Pantoea sp. FN0307 TaxID=3418560 RepID=UPI003CF332AB